MKTSIFTLVMCCFLSFSNFAQSKSDAIKVGDVFTVGKVEMNNYKHIKFPRNNFIIKRGGIATYKNVVNKEVKVTSLEEKKDGSLEAVIQLTSGRYFFKSHKYIKVDLNKALNSKELIAS
ncbi:dihydroorotase [Polaribacter sp. KT 15]|uniref:dihydroorotase n=1 Tax=Polaribacter sp. KT 15 TaxID=1896175 RepID=UPI00090B485E|nr:dihydroorotase [Polaribacter sp. KT 15]SHM99812.1 hypothetical protein SAMN05720268_1960 [Polaribacter sp. KT 15]